MKRINMKTLRSILFFLLAMVFVVLAVVEGLPKTSNSIYSQESAFTVKSAKNDDGTYTYLVEGSIKNETNRARYLGGVVVQVVDMRGETSSIEFDISSYIAGGEVRKLSGSTSGKLPADFVASVSTSAADSDMIIPVPERGLQIGKGFIIFAIMALLSLAMAIFFTVSAVKSRRRRHHHHHHHHHKSDENSAEKA